MRSEKEHDRSKYLPAQAFDSPSVARVMKASLGHHTKEDVGNTICEEPLIVPSLADTSGEVIELK